MAAPIRAVIGIVLTVASPASRNVDHCAQDGRSLFRALEMAQVEKEPESSIRDVYDAATRALATCPDDEMLAYLRLRAAELGRGTLVGQLAPEAIAELLRLAEGAAARFPESARILTVEARVSRRLDVARRACAADPGYVPAKVALADILVRSGDWRAAERALGDRSALAATSDGFVVLARIKLARGDARGALRATDLALHGRQVDLVEPDARDPRPAMEATEMAARARELAGSRERRAH